MFEEIRCPECGSDDWTTIDEVNDYSDDMNLKIKYICSCEKCGHDFDFVNTYMYLRTDWEKGE